MADRIFAAAILAIALAYTIIAFTIIRAPFQYDPLGPESWPQILGVLACLCCLWLIVRPDVAKLDTKTSTLGRLAIVVLMLFAYAWLYQPLGFVIATWVFAAAFSLLLGATIVRALIFGAATGIVGYFVCTILLELNLPDGLLKSLL
ncbi:tripartite tricarboxylate transporter TctB family protein [Nitratireductor aquibiodomus]|nr:tripartite tricarboxylate transporter TctB family protein [Nitratireductor aquibiodomus]